MKRGKLILIVLLMLVSIVILGKKTTNFVLGEDSVYVLVASSRGGVPITIDNEKVFSAISNPGTVVCLEKNGITTNYRLCSWTYYCYDKIYSDAIIFDGKMRKAKDDECIVNHKEGYVGAIAMLIFFGLTVWAFISKMKKKKPH